MEVNTKKHWIVLAALSFLAMSSLGLVINVSGVFLSPISESLGILRGDISMHSTLTQFAGAIVGIFIPKLMKNFHIKKILFAGIALSAGSSILLGFANSLWMFNILGTVRGIGFGMSALVPLTIIINQWFLIHNGLATSIVMTAPGIMGVIFSPIFSAIIEQYNWRIGYILLGVLMILLSIFPLLYPFSLRPEDDGYKALGYERIVPKDKQKESEESTENSKNDGKGISEPKIHFGQVILFMVASLLISGVTSFIQHLPGFAESIGFSAVAGGTLLSAAMVGNIVFKLLIGFVIDKTNAFTGSFMILIISAISAFLLLFDLPQFVLIIAAFGMGSIYSVSTVGITSLTSYFFGINNYGRIYPTVAFFKSSGIAIFLSLFGYIYDLSGSFSPSILLIIGLIFISSLFFVYNKIQKNKEKTCL